MSCAFVPFSGRLGSPPPSALHRALPHVSRPVRPATGEKRNSALPPPTCCDVAVVRPRDRNPWSDQSPSCADRIVAGQRNVSSPWLGHVQGGGSQTTWSRCVEDLPACIVHPIGLTGQFVGSGPSSASIPSTGSHRLCLPLSNSVPGTECSRQAWRERTQQFSSGTQMAINRHGGYARSERKGRGA